MNSLLERRRNYKANGTPTIHMVGDIAYWNGSSVKYVPYTEWSSSLGTALAVCVIPTTHAEEWGNGKARFLSATGVNGDGTQSSTENQLNWGPGGVVSGLGEYTTFVHWDTSSYAVEIASSDTFIATDKATSSSQNPLDTTTYYLGIGIYGRQAPSIYDSDGGFYDNFIAFAANGNVCSDLDGASNTDILAGLGSSYQAAYACSLYSTNGIPSGEWYLPAYGELCYMMQRWNVISQALTAIGGTPLSTTSDSFYASSTQYDGSRNMGIRVDTAESTPVWRGSQWVRPYVQLD